MVCVMEQIAIYPLDHFYRELGAALPRISPIKGKAMPEPQRHLLVHSGDMTGRLEQFHQHPIHLQILHKHLGAEFLSRMVVLLSDQGRPLEFGAIRIHLNSLPEKARQQVCGCYLPLGGILNSNKVDFASQVGGYFSLEADDLINGALQASKHHKLYGRVNRLVTHDGLTIADVVEILPH